MLGVVLSGGRGIRMAPATSFMNKHLLPIYSGEGAIPMLFYPISTLVRSGIRDILVISSREHAGPIIERLSDGRDFGANFTYKIQDTNHVPFGIASALQLAEDFTGKEKFAVILGDNFFEDTFTERMRAFECDSRNMAHVFLKRVNDPQRFGVATIVSNDNGLSKIQRIVEKPKEPGDDLAVTGLYLYGPEVYNIPQTLEISPRGELEITDINNYYCRHERLAHMILEGFWSDLGTPDSMVRAQEFIRENKIKVMSEDLKYLTIS